MSVTKYTFSGHESFTCKTLWLKKGYDFILDSNAAPYSKKSFEVTGDLLKAMGVDPASAKGRDEGK